MRTLLGGMLVVVCLFSSAPVLEAQEPDPQAEKERKAHEREAARLVRQIDKMLEKGKHSEALELYRKLKAKLSQTEVFAKEGPRLDELMKDARARTSILSDYCQGDLKVGGEGVSTLTYEFDELLEVGDFDRKGRLTLEQGALRLASGTSLGHRLLLSQDLRIELELSDKSHLELFVVPPGESISKGVKVVIRAGEGALLYRRGTSIDKIDLESRALTLSRRANKWQLQAAGRTIETEADAGQTVVLGFQSRSSNTRIERLVVSGMVQVPPQAPEQRFLPEGLPVDLTGGEPGAIERRFARQGDWDVFEGMLVGAGKNGVVSDTVLGDLRGRSYSFAFQVQAEFKKGRRDRDDTTVLVIAFPTGERITTWSFRGLFSILGKGKSRRLSRMPTLEAGQWIQVVVKVEDGEAHGYVGGKLAWSKVLNDDDGTDSDDETVKALQKHDGLSFLVPEEKNTVRLRQLVFTAK